MNITVVFKKYSILVLPLIFLFAGINFNRAKYINDPDYIYIINALAICDGKSVGHVDNPGTTVMQIGAVTMAIMHFFSNPENESLINHVLTNPDHFVEGIRLVFVFLNAFILFFLGLSVLKKIKSFWVAILFQISCFISANALDHIWSKVSPEPLLFFITVIYTIAILFYYAESEKNSWKYVFIFSLITGAGLGTKATFIPLIIFPIIVLPTFKKKVVYLAGTVISFVLFTIPAIPEYKGMYFWFRNLITHSGIYGQGEKKIIDIESYLPDLIKIIGNNPLLTIVIFIGLIFIILKRTGIINSKQDWNLKFLIGLISTLIFGVLLVAKHYGANHYLIPELLLTGITLFYISKILSEIKTIEKINQFIIPFLVFLIAIILIWNQPKKLIQTSRNYGLSTREIEATDLMVKNTYSDYTLINYYTFSLNKFTALKFGDIYAKGRIRSYLKKKYPNTYFYDFYNDRFLNWDIEVQLNNIIEENSNKILLMNGPADKPTLSEMASRGFPVIQIYKGNVQNIFMLDTLRYISLTNPDEPDYEIIDSFGAESKTEDGSFFLSSNSKIVGSSDSQTNEQARSGIYSVKLDDKTQFAVEYQMDSIKSGEIYEVDVWRKTLDSPAFLVVSSKQQEIYYRPVNQAIKTDTNGWELLQIKFGITQEMSRQPLIIYFWNPQQKPVFFDDLLIKKLK